MTITNTLFLINEHVPIPLVTSLSLKKLLEKIDLLPGRISLGANVPSLTKYIWVELLCCGFGAGLHSSFPLPFFHYLFAGMVSLWERSTSSLTLGMAFKWCVLLSIMALK